MYVGGIDGFIMSGFPVCNSCQWKGVRSMGKKFEELDVMDDYLMTAMSSDAEVGEDACRLLISTLLQREIGKVSVTSQRVLTGALPNYRGSKMPNLYIIMILNFDLFGKDYMMYTFHNTCEEVPEICYEDGLKFIYFYTGGSKGGNSQIRNLLRYLEHSTEDNVADDTTKKMHQYVERIKTMS